MTKGNKRSAIRSFYAVFWVPSFFEASFKFRKALFNCFFRRVSSKQSYCFAFNENTFNAWWVAQDELRKLEGLGRLVMGFDVQDGNFCKSLPFYTVVSRKVIWFSDISAVNLVVG